MQNAATNRDRQRRYGTWSAGQQGSRCEYAYARRHHGTQSEAVIGNVVFVLRNAPGPGQREGVEWFDVRRREPARDQPAQAPTAPRASDRTSALYHELRELLRRSSADAGRDLEERIEAKISNLRELQRAEFAEMQRSFQSRIPQSAEDVDAAFRRTDALLQKHADSDSDD